MDRLYLGKALGSLTVCDSSITFLIYSNFRIISVGISVIFSLSFFSFSLPLSFLLILLFWEIDLLLVAVPFVCPGCLFYTTRKE